MASSRDSRWPQKVASQRAQARDEESVPLVERPGSSSMPGYGAAPAGRKPAAPLDAPSPLPTARIKLPVVNTLRFLAIVYVILDHMEYTCSKKKRRSSWGIHYGLPLWARCLLWPLGAQEKPGSLGVTFFFILSGTVGWLPMVNRPDREVPSDGRRQLWAHLRKKAARLLPLYYIVWFVAQINCTFGYCMLYVYSKSEHKADPTESREWWSDFFLGITLTNTMSPRFFWPGPSSILWALQDIFWFTAAIFPIATRAFRGTWLGPVNRWSTLTQGREPELGIALSTAAIFTAVATAIRVFASIPYFGWYKDNSHVAVGDSALGRMDEFVLGMVLSYFFVSVNMKRYVGGLLVIVGYAGIFFYLLAEGEMMRNFDADDLTYDSPIWLVRPLLSPLRNVAFCTLAMGLHHLFDGGGVAAAAFRFPLLSNWLFQTIGAMSFSIYVWHDMAVNQMFLYRDHKMVALDLECNFKRILFCLAVYISPIAYLSYTFIEGGKFDSSTWPSASEDFNLLWNKMTGREDDVDRGSRQLAEDTYNLYETVGAPHLGGVVRGEQAS